MPDEPLEQPFEHGLTERSDGVVDLSIVPALRDELGPDLDLRLQEVEVQVVRGQAQQRGDDLPFLEAEVG